MSGLERRLEALERRAGPGPVEGSPEIVAFGSILPEEDRRAILDLFESGDRREDEDTALSRATAAQRRAYLRFDSLRDLPLTSLQLLEGRVADDPEYLTPYLQAVDVFWQAIEDHGGETVEARRAARAFQRQRQALHRDLEDIDPGF